MDTEKISKEEFLELKAEEVERGFPTQLDSKNITYLDVLSQHDRYLLVYPTTYISVPEHLQVGIQFIHTDPDNDFYPVEGGKFCPHDTLWRKIEYAAGIEWIHALCGFTDLIYRPTSGEVQRVAYRAYGTVRLMDGSITNGEGDKSLDFDNLSPTKKPRSDKNLQMLKATCRERVQTGAKNRVIQRLLGLPSSFTRDQIRKIWVVPKVMPKIDMRDRSTRQMLIGMFTLSQNILYHQAAASSLQLPGGQQTQQIAGPVNGAVEEPTETASANQTPSPAPAPSPDPAPQDSAPPPQAAEKEKPKKTGKWEQRTASEPVDDCHTCKQEIKPDRDYWFHTGTNRILCLECAEKARQSKKARTK